MKVLDTSTGAQATVTPRGRYPAYVLREPGEDYITDHLLRGGRWEWPLIERASLLLAPGDVFVDVGANLGVWSLTLAKLVPGITAHAFEPFQETYYQLCGNIFLNGLSSAIFAHKIALGSGASDRSRLFQPEERSFGGVTLVPDQGAQVVESGISMRELDTFQLSPAVIKIDVEGYEQRVLDGARETIARTRPAIFFEAWDPELRGEQFRDRRDHLFGAITRLGYRFEALNREDFLALPRAP